MTSQVLARLTADGHTNIVGARSIERVYEPAAGEPRDAAMPPHSRATINTPITFRFESLPSMAASVSSAAFPKSLRAAGITHLKLPLKMPISIVIANSSSVHPRWSGDREWTADMRNTIWTTLRTVLSSLTLCFCLTLIAAAQISAQQDQSNPSTGQDDSTRQLLQRLQDLEAELKQFRAHSAPPAPATVAVSVPAPAFVPPPALAPPPAESAQARDAYVTGVAGRPNGSSMGVHYDFDPDGIFKLHYDRISGAICLLQTR